MNVELPNPERAPQHDWDSPDFEIPPYLRPPERGTRQATENMIQAIDNKIAKLARLGLRPHPNMLDYRRELGEQLKTNGPYRLRMSGGIF